MTSIVEATNTGSYVLINGVVLEPSDARELAKKLIECAHECDKRRRRVKCSIIEDENGLDRHVSEHLVQ